MKKIIFVDDEPNILQGLKRMLRSMRKEYELFFAEGGNAALEIMSTENIDVVVSDMRMPGMDGAELLTKIQELHPQTIRIMLTGQADEDSVMRTVGVAHQFLAKPCDPDKLKNILQKTSALQDLLFDGRLKDIVSKIGSLPSLPGSFSELQDAINNPDSSIGEVAEIVEKDVAMCAKVLQLVNSSFFGLFNTVESPSRAVNLLGLDTIRALVLSVGIFNEVKGSNKFLSQEQLSDHSLMVGQLAKKIAETQNNDKLLISDSFLAGIMHDIGKLIFLSHLSDQFEEAIELAKSEEISLDKAEQKIIGSSHSDIGAYLAGLWGFNNSIVEAIGFAHQLDKYPEDTFSVAMAVHVADFLFYKYNPEGLIGAPHQLSSTIIENAGLGEQVEKWDDLGKEMFETVAN